MKSNVILLIFIFILLSLIQIFYNDPLIVFRLNILFQMILIAGILAMSGYILQTLMHNPLVEPYTIGVSSGAVFGAVLAVFLNLKPLLIYRSFFALIGSLMISFFIYFISNTRIGFSISMAVLVGIGINAFFSNFVVFIQNLLRPNDFVASVSWIMGNIDTISINEIVLLAFAFLFEIVYLIKYSRELEIYKTGEEMAISVGVNTEELKKIGFIVSAISSGIAVSICGMIGFIGLICPRITELIVGYDNKQNKLIILLLISFNILILAGILSKNLIRGGSLPIGTITSILGAPFFIYILIKSYKF